MTAMAPTPPKLSPKEVGIRIKAARMLRGVTQDELAERVARDGMAFRMVGKLERGLMEIRPAHIRALCLALGFPELWFTTGLDDFLNAVHEINQGPRELFPLLEEILERVTHIEGEIGGQG